MSRFDEKKLGLAAVAVIIPIALILLGSVFPTASNQDYAPEQPIPFSHKLHAGTNKIACQYCHSNADKSQHATIPAVATCMNCHIVVKTDSPHIQKIKKAFEENKPIEWTRIHELPDFVYFPHKRHVAKGVACETCHGDIKTMDRVFQFAPLTMGWCLDCHRGQTTPKNIHAKFYPGDKNPHGKPIVNVNCSTCHN